MDHSRDLLDLLDCFAREGGGVVALHVFSGDKEIGKMILKEGGVLLFGDVDFDLSNQLKSYVESRYGELSGKRISQFSVSVRDLAFQVTAEVLEIPPHLYVFGAGHVGQAVAMIGALVGYDVVVVDDRGEFLARDRFPNDRIKLFEKRYDSVAGLGIKHNSAVVIVTRGHQFDEVCLEQVLSTDAKYIGMIGSRRRVLSIFSRLAATGITRESLSRVHAPIGLRIGAVSPQEIGVAIMAEIIGVMNGS